MLDIPLTREESRPLIEAVNRGIISKRLSTRMPGDGTRQDASRNSMKEVDDLHTSIPPPRTAVDEVDYGPFRRCHPHRAGQARNGSKVSKSG